MEIICLYGNPDSGKTEALNMLAKKILEEMEGCKIIYESNLDEKNDIDSNPEEIGNFLVSGFKSDWNLILQWNTKKIGFTMKGDNLTEIEKGLAFIDKNRDVDIFLIAARRKGSDTYNKVEQYAKEKQDIAFTLIHQRKIQDKKRKEDIIHKNDNQVITLYNIIIKPK
ncbi:MAG: hypothetical protein VB088_02190 [Sphaerochaeta sp.]|nr:hypothetical protein [Sphaerochaeta sp.]